MWGEVAVVCAEFFFLVSFHNPPFIIFVYLFLLFLLSLIDDALIMSFSSYVLVNSYVMR